MGSVSRPTFEMGESSKSPVSGLRVTNSPIPTGQNSLRVSHSDPIILVSPQGPDKDKIIGLSPVCEGNGRKEKAETLSSDAKCDGDNWPLLLNDGCRVEVHGHWPSPWDFLRSNLGGELPRWVPMENGFQIPTFSTCEAIVEWLAAKNPNLALEVPCDVLELVPLAMDFSMVEKDIASITRMLGSVNGQQKLSEWVMGQMKRIGKLLGASYEGNEEVVMEIL